jgi:hypothetical protein
MQDNIDGEDLAEIIWDDDAVDIFLNLNLSMLKAHRLLTALQKYDEQGINESTMHLLDSNTSTTFLQYIIIY